MLSPGTLRRLAADELVQLEQEGCEVAELRELCERAAQADDATAQASLVDFFERAAELSPAPGWPYEEPSDWEGIRAARPDADLSPVASAKGDRLTGAWLGRCIGCMMGKPVEGRSRAQIEAILRAADAYPLSGYFPALDSPPEGVSYRPPDDPCLAPNITRGVRDDDTDYTVLGMHMIEEFGPAVTPEQIVEQWFIHLPYHRVFTAERAAMRNWVNEIMPPRSALYMNPYREWIGAQIRADGWAYCAPGWPEMAAEYAWRDACTTHTKNGIYGEMFFAALIAACFATDDLSAALQLALAAIPENSRLSEAVRDCLAWCEQDETWEQTWERIMERYGHYHAVHTINNALLVLMGLLHAEGDMTRAIAIAVMGGLDTDCNGATAGSVMGALLGEAGVPGELSGPLNDTLEVALAGMPLLSISDLVARTLEMAKLTLAGAS
jgi:ADP-ribosylglycohydrolase